MTETLTGKCFCSAVEYSVPDAFVYAMNCHCSNCRRTTGSAFKPFAGIERRSDPDRTSENRRILSTIGARGAPTEAVR